jgi:hypothetical protein
MAQSAVQNAIVPLTIPNVEIAPKHLSSVSIDLVPAAVVEKQQALVVPNPMLNIIFTREGDILKGTGHLINGGRIEVFTASVNLNELGKAMLGPGGVHGDDLVAFFGSIVKAVKSIAKSKIVRSISRAAKSVVQSKALGAAVAGLAVVFPPVGLPAAGAFAAANVALAAIENGNKAIKEGERLVASGKGLTARDKAMLKFAIDKKKRAQARLQLAVNKAKKPPNPRLGMLQKAVFAKNRELKARGAPTRFIPPVSPQAYARIIGRVAKSRLQIANIKKSLDLPQKAIVIPKVIKTPIGKGDLIVVFWRKFLKEHPIQAVRVAKRRLVRKAA